MALGGDRPVGGAEGVAAKRARLHVHEAARATGATTWYLTALDFRDRRDRSGSASPATGLGFNNNYAPITIGPEGGSTRRPRWARRVLPLIASQGQLGGAQGGGPVAFEDAGTRCRCRRSDCDRGPAGCRGGLCVDRAEHRPLGQYGAFPAPAAADDQAVMYDGLTHSSTTSQPAT